jgi:hypothetical protein
MRYTHGFEHFVIEPDLDTFAACCHQHTALTRRPNEGKSKRCANIERAL